MPKTMIAGNWKMYKTADEAVAFVDKLTGSALPVKQVQVLICPSALAIPVLTGDSRLSRLGIQIGAQNGHWEKEGAYTGEIAMQMIRETGCSHVLVGHSERRASMGETDIMVHKKIKEALRVGLVPILCVGETAEQRQEDQTEEVVGQQIRTALEDIDFPTADRLVVAYEPVWAIGSGTPALPDDASYVHRFIRMILAEMNGEKWADEISILYGGSVKPDNIEGFLSVQGIDGALIGGASLQPHHFLDMVMKVAKERT